MKDFKNSAKMFKALCDENRLKIMHILTRGEYCACKLLDTLNIGQPTLSHHMAVLCKSGLVSSRRQGKWTHYKINKKGAAAANAVLAKLVKASCKKSGCGCGQS